MITSMTGFGRGEASAQGVSVSVEARTVNSRFLEIFSNLPKKMYHRDFELRELVKKKVSRGKINISIAIEYGPDSTTTPVRANLPLAAAYFQELQEIKKHLKVKDAVRLEDVLKFSTEIFKNTESSDSDEKEWVLIADALNAALDRMNTMRLNEGRELARDLMTRVRAIEEKAEAIEKMAAERIPQERQKLREKVAKLFENDEIDEQRLEMEIVLLADKLDISEECVRLKSHIKFFIEALKGKEQAGRTINFLLQEMHREINTCGSKANDAAIAQIVVGVKEELERIREQVQNVE
jgi:uncharacterized protein (TIGR00255 family)